uniref:Uncharacterized protein n=1 Tax=Anopheles albimanus TaxID=7167 RepID=A0A182FYN4_ANOAL
MVGQDSSLISANMPILLTCTGTDRPARRDLSRRDRHRGLM